MINTGKSARRGCRVYWLLFRSNMGRFCISAVVGIHTQLNSVVRMPLILFNHSARHRRIYVTTPMSLEHVGAVVTPINVPRGAPQRFPDPGYRVLVSPSAGFNLLGYDAVKYTHNNKVYRIHSPSVAFLLDVWWEYAPHASVGYIEGVFNASHYMRHANLRLTLILCYPAIPHSPGGQIILTIVHFV